jgi:hypothetical protein
MNKLKKGVEGYGKTEKETTAKIQRVYAGI